MMNRAIRLVRSRKFVVNGALTQNRCQFSRKFSTNPMFPERARPEIDSFFDKPEKPGDKKSNAAPDFLSNHGGKVALAALGVAIALFYSYWVGGQNRNKVEEEVLKYSLIEPYEIQEMRYLNNVTNEEYAKTVQQCKDHFRGGFTTYNEFVKFLKTQTFVKNLKLQQSHLLDRFIQSYITQTFQITGDANLDTSSRKSMYFGIPKDATSPPAVKFHDVPISLDLLLVAFSLFMFEDGMGRVEGLFSLAEINSDRAVVSTGGADSASPFESSGGFADHATTRPQGSTTVTTTSDAASSDSSNNNSGANNGDEISTTRYASTKSIHNVLRLLIETDQIPPEKQVIEEGTKWPVKLYRRKEAKEMIEAYRTTHKIPADQQIENLSLLEFQTLLLSGQVCAWAECYRRATPSA